MPAAGSKPSAKLVGRSQPRLFTPPRRKLTRLTTRGFEVIEFAVGIGQPLMPWQAWLVKHALELNPDGTYRFRIVLVLVARQNGKSQVKRVVTLWRIYLDGARTVLGLAQDIGLATEQWTLSQDMIRDCPDLAVEFGKAHSAAGNQWFWLHNGARYLVRAMNRRAGRGYTIDEVNVEELREQRDWKAWSAVSKTVMARANAQIWCTSNAGDDESVVLNQLREAALAGSDPSIGLFEWSGPDGCELDDPKAIAQANPGLGHIVSEQAIRTALATDPPAVYRTEVLCQRVEQLDGAFDMAAWRDCRDATGNMDGLRRRLVAGFDVAPDGEHATLEVAAVMSDGRVRIEVVAAWDGGADIRAGLDEWLAKIKPRVVAWYPAGPAAAYAPVLRPPARTGQSKRRRLACGAESIELTGGKVAEACQGIAELVITRRLLHPGDPLLDSHMAGAQKLYSADGWRFARRGAGHVDAAYAAAAAVQAALTRPVHSRPRVVVARSA